jgi:uncharacterized membrane protein YeaQ/YmgE (transglycosylase-associated protein family)
MILGFVSWMAVGLVVGFIASKIVDLHGDDARLGPIAACGGAIIGGVLCAIFSGTGVSIGNGWGLAYATGGAVVAVVMWHAVRSRYVSRVPQTRRSSY